MKKDYEELVEEIEEIKSRLYNVEKMLAGRNFPNKIGDTREDQIKQILNRAKIRAIEMAQNMTEEEVWDYYEKSVSKLKAARTN